MRNIPLDLKAETLLGYIPRERRRVELRGSHKRNAYEDITGISVQDGSLVVSLARNGMYDILPESMFHPVDRFDNIPANEYDERFKEECELQQIEEENARKYFRPFDTFLTELSTVVSDCKNNENYSAVIENIIIDRITEEYRENRFTRKATPFLPHCSRIRGNKTLFTLMLRHILFDEGILVSEQNDSHSFKDDVPRYEYTVQDNRQPEKNDVFLGNEFDEVVTVYRIHFWKEDECDGSFLNFVAEMRTFEDFLNDFFMGIDTKLKFDISTDSLPVRLADDLYYNYLDYNTNI